MQTPSPERSGALSIASVDVGSTDNDGLGKQLQLLAGVAEGLRPPVPIPLAIRAESRERGARVVVRGRGKARTEATAGSESSAEFVLALPRSLSASEVVARAQQQDLTISEPFVYKARYDAMTLPEPVSAAPTVIAPVNGDSKADNQQKASTPETPKGTSVAVLNKSDFIRSLPATLSAAEVVARAKAQGISIAESHVYGVRAAARAGAKPSAPTKVAEVPPAPPKEAKQSKAEFVRSLPRDASYAQAAGLHPKGTT